jgi:DNA-binding NarL/FixJ family response regulator
MVIINDNLQEQKKIPLIKWGVKGFLPENTSLENMKKAFDAVLKGELWISRHLTYSLLNQLLDKSSLGDQKKPAQWYELSKREEEILQAVAAGLSNQKISDKFSISENTVKLHINHIFKKLNVKSRTQAVMKAWETRII